MKTQNTKEKLWRKLEEFNANSVDELTQSLGQLVFTDSGRIRTRPADVPMALILSFYTRKGKLLKGAALLRVWWIGHQHYSKVGHAKRHHMGFPA